MFILFVLCYTVLDNFIEKYLILSAGTERNARIKVTPGLLGWADIIFCMEKKHLRRIKEKYSDIIADKKVVCLHIADDYEFMDQELQNLLKDNVDVYI